MKIIVNKLIGDLGEQWSVEIPVTNDVLKSKDPVVAIEAITNVALRVADNRLQSLNQRLLDSNRMAQTLTPEAMLALRQTVEVLYGSRVPPEGLKRPTTEPVPPDDTKVVSSLETALEAMDEAGR